MSEMRIDTDAAYCPGCGKVTKLLLARTRRSSMHACSNPEKCPVGAFESRLRPGFYHPTEPTKNVPPRLGWPMLIRRSEFHRLLKAERAEGHAEGFWLGLVTGSVGMRALESMVARAFGKPPKPKEPAP